MEAYIKTIKYLTTENKSLNIVDIGCARSAFVNEFLVNYISKDKIKSLGVDPFDHSPQFNPRNHYNFYVQGCVDNIPQGEIKEELFYINEIDQASSLLKINSNLFSSDLNDKDKFYYPQDIINRLSRIIKKVKVKVYNLSDLIEKYFDENEVIDFIKIDAEGKDLDICKSLGKTLERIRFIGVECSSHENDNLRIFENGGSKKECIDFFESNNFEIFDCIDYVEREDNLTQMSDLVFKNKLL